MPIVLEGGSVTRQGPVTFPVASGGVVLAQVFVNRTGAQICGIAIGIVRTTGEWAFPPKVTRIDAFALDSSTGRTVGPIGHLDPGAPYGAPSVVIHPPVNHGDSFKLDVAFNGTFAPGAAVVFTPADDQGAAIA